MARSSSVLIIARTPEKLKRYEALVRSGNSTCQIVTAMSGADGRAKIENDVPSFVLIEDNLKKLTGSQIVEWIFAKSHLKDLPCVLLTNEQPDEVFLAALASGRLHLLPLDAKNEEIGEALRATVFFLENINGAERDFKMKMLAKGEMLFKQGETSQSVYLLKSGRLKAVMERSGSVVHLGNIEEGEFVGEMAYISGAPRTAHVSAEEDSELIEIPVGTMDYLLRTKPSWSKALLKTLSKRIEDSNKRKVASSG